MVETDGAMGARSVAPISHGIDEMMPIDQSKHSLFGASKVAADILVQEYGTLLRYADRSFRGGCLTGPAHSGTELHGFLAYLGRCAVTGRPYTIYGYKGKQVRDNIHSQRSRAKHSGSFSGTPNRVPCTTWAGHAIRNCSMLEAITIIEELCGKTSGLRTFRTSAVRAITSGGSATYAGFSRTFPQWAYTLRFARNGGRYDRRPRKSGTGAHRDMKDDLFVGVTTWNSELSSPHCLRAVRRTAKDSAFESASWTTFQGQISGNCAGYACGSPCRALQSGDRAKSLLVHVEGDGIHF